FQQQSHELRAAFGADSPLHGQIGGYFFREESSLELNIGAPLSQIVGGANAVGFAFPQGPTVARSIAGFGQLTYDLTDDLHISVGGRYTSDDKSRNGATVVDTRNVNTGVITRTVINENIASRGYNKFTWRAGIDYDVPGLGLVYASVSTGYKAGGFNDGCLSGAGVGCSLTASALYYDPETLTAYEGGFKFRLMDNALRLNASVFHYDYSGLQISQLAIVSGVPATLIRNAATAKIDGVELEAVVNPGDNTRFDFGFTYTNSRYTNFVPDSVNYPTFSFNGLPLDHAPELTASAGITQTIPLGNGGEIEASARTRLSSAYYMQDLNNLSQFRQPAFTKTDLTLTYNAPERAWFVQGFVKNLENEITLAAANSGTFSSATIETPRTFGVRAGIRF
ncbi:MAG: TonB-dependent receptor, partial [Sphingopyxis sp.]